MTDEEKLRDVAQAVVFVMTVAIDCGDLNLEQSLVALRSCSALLVGHGITAPQFAAAFAVAAASTDNEMGLNDLAQALLAEAEKT